MFCNFWFHILLVIWLNLFACHAILLSLPSTSFQKIETLLLLCKNSDCFLRPFFKKDFLLQHTNTNIYELNYYLCLKEGLLWSVIYCGYVCIYKWHIKSFDSYRAAKCSGVCPYSSFALTSMLLALLWLLRILKKHFAILCLDRLIFSFYIIVNLDILWW